MKRVRTSFNFIAEIDIEGETTNLPSQTIPDQTKSLQDHVNEFVITSEWPKVPKIDQFDTEDTLNLPDLNKMSEIEKRDFSTKVGENIASTQAELADFKTSREKKAKIEASKAKTTKVEEPPAEPPKVP
jgi:hypothetical protein